MKIITKKQSKAVAKNLTNELRILLIKQGVRPKELLLLKFENQINKILGGEKK